MYIAIGIAAVLFITDRVLKYLSRTGKLRYEGRLLRLTHLENHGFFMSFGLQHPRLVRWMPWAVWLLAAACLLPQLSRRPFAAQQHEVRQIPHQRPFFDSSVGELEIVGDTAPAQAVILIADTAGEHQ